MPRSAMNDAPPLRSSRKVSCPYCGAAAEFVGGLAIYPRRDDLADRRFWRCTRCSAWVGCHRGHGRFASGDVPMGRLANAELRAAKRHAHEVFDPLWQSGSMTRKDAYRWLSKALGFKETVHIGDMDVEGCRLVVLCCRMRSKEAA